MSTDSSLRDFVVYLYAICNVYEQTTGIDFPNEPNLPFVSKFIFQN